MKLYSVIFILILSFFFLTQISVCQNNFIKGKIETLNSKSTKGLINYDKLNPSTVMFTKSNNDQIITYSPEQLKGFSIGKDVFRSTTVNVNSTNDKAVFVQVLVGGKKTLLALYGIESSHFLIEDNDKIVLLGAESYRDQLAKYLLDCNYLWKSLGSANYDEKSLTSLFKEYYKCAGLKIKSGSY